MQVYFLQQKVWNLFVAQNYFGDSFVLVFLDFFKIKLLLWLAHSSVHGIDQSDKHSLDFKGQFFSFQRWNFIQPSVTSGLRGWWHGVTEIIKQNNPSLSAFMEFSTERFNRYIKFYQAFVLLSVTITNKIVRLNILSFKYSYSCQVGLIAVSVYISGRMDSKRFTKISLKLLG